MELSKKLLDDESLKAWNAKGELLPDPNLIWNIDHLVSFIELELDLWKNHCIKTEEEIKDIHDAIKYTELLKDANLRVYIKTLFDISTYYIACVQALERLISQLYKISTEHYQLKVKKPKFEPNNIFHDKVQFIRDKSFIHQDSSKVANTMDKRAAMSWTPTITHKNDEVPSCESYQFGGGKWWVKVNGVKTESEIDISISGITEFAKTALEQLEIRKSRVVVYYEEIKHNKKIQVMPTAHPKKKATHFPS